MEKQICEGLKFAEPSKYGLFRRFIRKTLKCYFEGLK
jgi:hypothetical protein